MLSSRTRVLLIKDNQGLETFCRVRAEAPHLPFVILTAADDSTLAAKTVEEGAQAKLSVAFSLSHKITHWGTTHDSNQ